MDLEDVPLEELVRAFLVCPRCRVPFEVREERLWCGGCDFEGAIRDDVVMMSRETTASYFDDKFLRMQEGHSEGHGDWEFAYRQQVAFLDRYLRPRSVVLDVGCGPSICYRRPEGSFLVGLEYSFPSIRGNKDVDLRICGSAAASPLRDGAVDLAVCFYSLHHMVGDNVCESRGILESVLGELGRVLKAGGHLVVFEMRPWWPFRLVQSLCWDAARRVLGGRLDMHMWPQAALEVLAKERLRGAGFEVRIFETSMLEVFPPVFALPWLKVPRMMYPLSPVAYVWAKP